ncbi:MAG TPA: hypothetical protein VIG64_03245 [Actinomycetota bacterium]|jgi:hypothetical protein
MKSASRRVAALTLGAQLLASACASDADGPALINYRLGQDTDLVGFEGELVDDDGCLTVEGNDSSTVPLWPEGFRLNHSDGEETLMDADGQVVAALGDQIRLGGGILTRKGAEKVALTPIPNECDGDRFFAVGQVGS